MAKQINQGNNMQTFTSQMAMVNAFNALAGADFGAKLSEDFGIVAPADVPPYQKEYLWKYMVQGLSFKGFSEVTPELIDYAVTATENLVRTQPHLYNKGLAVPTQKASKLPKTSKVRVVNDKQADGTVLFLEHRQVWVGYFGGKIQCSKKTEAAAREFLTTKFAV